VQDYFHKMGKLRRAGSEAILKIDQRHSSALSHRPGRYLELSFTYRTTSGIDVTRTKAA
jgi:hypothetical protein